MTVKGICNNCGIEFSAKNRKTKGKNIFCKQQCYFDFKRDNPPEPNCKCLQCGAEFRRKPSAIKNGEGRFCSIKCKHKFQRNGIEERGESYNDRHLIRQSSAYKSWRRAAKKRANYQCEECGLKEKTICKCCMVEIFLHVHHIKQFATHKDLRFDPLNSRVLCPACHSKK